MMDSQSPSIAEESFLLEKARAEGVPVATFNQLVVDHANRLDCPELLKILEFEATHATP